MADRQLKIVIVGDDSSAHRAFNRSSRDARGWSKGIERVSRGSLVATVGFRGLGRSVAFASGAFLGGAGLTVAFKSAISSASDLNEQINKTNVLFGKSAGIVQDFARTSAGAFGISRRAALEAAGGIGSMLETAGLTDEEAAKFSKRLVQLGADMASFNNIDPSEALEKLRSGLAGEAEPLRTVGVLLSETRVKQEAYRLGLAKTGEQLTEAQKVQARYSLILKDTAKQQGDFARTSTGLANSSRIVRAELDDIAGQIGSALLPAIAKATQQFAGFLRKLGEAQGVRAKISVVIEGAEGLSRQVAQFVRNEVLPAIERIDWREVGRAVGQGLVSSLDAIRAAIAGIDWGVVGRAIVRGIANFLKGVNWVAVFKALAKTMFATAKALIQLFNAIGVEIGKQIDKGISTGIDSLKDFVIQKLLAFVNKILGVTKFLGRFDPFKGVREKVRKQIAQMQADIDSLHGKDVTITVTTKEVGGGTAARTKPNPVVKVFDSIAGEIRAAADRAERMLKNAKTRTLRNLQNLMDELARAMTAADATPDERDNLRILKQQLAIVEDEIKISGRTKDLLDQEAQIKAQIVQTERSIGESQKQAAQEARQAAAEQRKAAAERRRAAVEAAREARQRKEFLALGLTGEGQDRLASDKTLKRRVANLREAVKGTVLDTKQTEAELNRIQKVLSGKFGKVGREVRQAIVDMLNEIQDALQGGDKKGPLTKTTSINSRKLTADLGLTPQQERELRSRLSNFNSAGMALAGSQTRPTGTFVGGPSGPIVVESHTTINLDGRKIADAVTRNQQKTRRRNPQQKRGPHRVGGV